MSWYLVSLLMIPYLIKFDDSLPEVCLSSLVTLNIKYQSTCWFLWCFFLPLTRQKIAVWPMCKLQSIGGNVEAVGMSQCQFTKEINSHILSGTLRPLSVWASLTYISDVKHDDSAGTQAGYSHYCNRWGLVHAYTCICKRWSSILLSQRVRVRG